MTAPTAAKTSTTMTEPSSSTKKKHRFRIWRNRGKSSKGASEQASSKKQQVQPPQVVNVNSAGTDVSAITTRAANPPHGAPKTKKKLKGSWLARTKTFRKMSDWAFDVVDADGSGEVDEKELYSGLLLIHLKLGCYAGPAACRPVDRQRVHDVFHKMDVDNSGSLDRDEFLEVMTVLCSNVLTRVMVQWSMTLIIVPLVAQYILNGLYWINCEFWTLVMELDEYSPIMDKLELWLEHQRDVLIEKTPDVIVNFCHKFMELLDKVPDSVWNTVPLTLLSCILGCIAVPYMIFKIDDYFQGVADKKKDHAVVEEET